MRECTAGAPIRARFLPVIRQDINVMASANKIIRQRPHHLPNTAFQGAEFGAMSNFHYCRYFFGEKDNEAGRYFNR